MKCLHRNTMVSNNYYKKYKKMTFLVAVFALFASKAAFADLFIETIADISARDALALKNGVIYASNYNTGEVFKVQQDGSAERILGTSTRGPAGIRIDSNGNLYIAMYNVGQVIKVDPQGNESVFASGINELIALDWDSNDNLYASSYRGSTTVTRIASDGTTTQIAKVNEIGTISSLCIDNNDDIYVTSYNSSDIYKVSQSGNVELFSSTGARGINYMQYDPVNDVFYATVSEHGLLKIDKAGNSEFFVLSSEAGKTNGPVAQAKMQSSIGLAVSEDGKNIYFASNSQIRRVVDADPTNDQLRPYFTSPERDNAEPAKEFSHQFEYADPNGDPLTVTVENLPSWLTFDNVDRVNGTPTSSDASQTFSLLAKVTDSNSIVAQNFIITVAANPTTPAPTPAPAPTPEPKTSSGGGSSTASFIALVVVALFLRRQR